VGAPDDDASLPPSTPLAHYVVRRRIGSGAMGTVYEAHDGSLDRTVAIKVVNPEFADDPAVVDRFSREARAAARANHENLTHVYFVGAAAGRPFYAMELVPGETLEERVTRDGPLSLSQAVDVLAQAARGLRAAHAVGVVHRDVKPANLILEPGGRVKVTDFGLAKSVGGDPTATFAGQVIGTPTYMSPEQCRGGTVDVRTDVYSLGLTAWFLLTGKPAFSGPTLGAVLDSQMNAPLPALSTANPAAAHGVDALLARLCAKDPKARPADMDEVVRLLEDARPREVRPAPFMARAAAVAFDLMLFGLLGEGLENGLNALGSRLGLAGHGAYEVFGFLLVTAFMLATLLVTEMVWGRTLGKHLLGLEVVAQDGSKPSPARVVLRFLVRFPGMLLVAVPRTGPELPRLVVQGLQIAAVVVGAGFYFARGRSTLSDVVTRTRVAYRDARGSSAS
jgi:uncharacterized RDD family membrane protein YckC